MSTAKMPTSVLKRLDSKVGEPSHGEGHLKDRTHDKRHGLYLPVGSRQELYAELLPELFIRDLSEIENVYRLRIAFVGDRSDGEHENELYNPPLHPKLRRYIDAKRVLCASKARFLLANPEAVATIRDILNRDTFLYIKADHLSPCALVRLMQSLQLTRVILDMRRIVEHNVFLKRFFDAARRADLRIDKFISLYGGSAGYNWAHFTEGHKKIAEYADNIWAQEGEEAESWFRCRHDEEEDRVDCWCKSESASETGRETEMSEFDVDRRTIIAANTKISEPYRGFLAWLQAEDDEEPQRKMIEWLESRIHSVEK